MPDDICQLPDKLDPWVASSLLQKAIRRGDEALAQVAALRLFQMRGKGIWRRLLTIAFEDVGIANPGLLLDTASLASDPRLREMIGTEIEVLQNLSKQLAAAAKDRSADYLFCGATKLENAQRFDAQLGQECGSKWPEIAMERERSLIERAVALLKICSHTGEREKNGLSSSFEAVLERAGRHAPVSLLNATALAVKLRCDPIVLMPMLLWTDPKFDPAASTTNGAVLSCAPQWQGVPLYAYDKHTWAGKKAISAFSRQCSPVCQVLAENTRSGTALEVAFIACFYADGYLLANRLDWPLSQSLELLGIEADLTFAGAKRSGVDAIMDCVRRNVDALHESRFSVLAGRIAQ